LRTGSLITARFAGEQGSEVFAVPGSPHDPRSEGCNRLIRQGATLITGAEDVMEALRPLIESGAPRSPPLREMAAGEAEPLWDEWAELADPAPVASPERPLPQISDHEALIALIGLAPISVDELVRRSGLPLRRVQLELTELDLAGRLARHGENRVSLR
jgi:DNA processing protein